MFLRRVGAEETCQGCHQDTIASTTIHVGAMFDACKIDDGINEIGLLGTTIHSIGISDLHRSGKSMIIRDAFGALCSLLTVRSGKCLRLKGILYKEKTAASN